MNYQASSSAGFKWTQSLFDYSKTSRRGHASLGIDYYLKADLLAKFSIVLNRLFSQELEIELPTTELKQTFSATYWTYENDLCLDISSSITDFIFDVATTLRLVQCEKNMIDSFDDFGQFAQWDNENAKKPYSPFAKFFDKCDLSTVSSVTVKEY